MSIFSKVPIFIKLLVFSCLLVIIITSFIGFLVLDVQKKQFERQLIDFGSSLIHILAKNAPDKILAEEDLTLFKLVKDITANEQIVMASITNAQNIIIAHSDLDRVNKISTRPGTMTQKMSLANGVSIGSFTDNDKPFFYLEAPLTYQDIHIGNAQLMISQKVIADSIDQSKQHILVSFVIIIIVALLVSLVFSIYFARPIRSLEKSVAKFGAGNFTHRTKVSRNDELGDLAVAFNRMARDLELKEKMKNSFGTYVAPEIVDMIMSTPNDTRVKAASKEATVMFSDIRGFTALSENMPPEKIVEMLNEHFSRITKIIIEHGGHIDKFIGDSAMAVFGITKKTDNHAVEAVNAAIKIMALMKNSSNGQDESTALRVGIGINTGPMVAGSLGSNQKMEYTVIGDNVNIASRLTSMAGPGEILISGRTYDRLKAIEKLVAWEKGQISIKGKKNKIIAFTIMPSGEHL